MSTRAPDGPTAAVALRRVVTSVLALAALAGSPACYEPPDTEDPSRSEERADPLASSAHARSPSADAQPGAAAVSLHAPELVEVPPEAHSTASGVHWLLLEQGAGDVSPHPRDAVEVDFVAWTGDGRLLDTSLGDGVAVTFPLQAVAPGLRDVLTEMVVGERRRVWIPAEEARGDCPRRTPPEGERVVLEVALLGVDHSRTIPAPPDVAEPPWDAERTRDGLAWRTLGAPEGDARPTLEDAVVVHYTGWTTAGEMFDSSVLRDEPAVFRLARIIPGLRLPLLDMRAGERRRVWVPAELAWGAEPSEPGVPAGDVVFDLLLLEIR